MKEPGYVAETLRWCNRKRKERGWSPLNKLPKGIRGNGESCPCGAVTGLFVSKDYYVDRVASRSIELPRSVKRFVDAFDSGRLPQYDVAEND